MEQRAKSIDKLAINAIRTLAADAIQKANSGHPGIAIGAAPIGYAMFNAMRHNPKNPNWRGRDRFILSAGHGSMLLYSLLHINGYPLSIEDIKSFRQLNSHTPGHPEITTTGVEASTGPLGQGFAMAVGMAMAEAHMSAVFNRDGYPVFDNYTYTLLGDGCMMEGAASEAASMAGALGLGKLIAVYDSNAITIEGDTDAAFTENVALRFKAYGFHVIDIPNGEDVAAITEALEVARAETDRPSLIIVHTNIAHGTLKEGKASSHGSPLGEETIAKMKKDLAWDYPPFCVPNEVYAHFSELQKARAEQENEYNAMLAEYEKAYPELYAKMNEYISGEGANERLEMLYDADRQGGQATRNSSGEILNKLFSELGFSNLFGGSADLGPSNMTTLNGEGFFGRGQYENANIHFGIRELAMAAACNGMALYGGLRPFCATFMVFSDYLKPAMRLSALMELPIVYVLTHDSIGVGEDGATHHPIEQLAAIRSMPGVKLFRPADYNETAAAYTAALTAKGPTALALSRQALPQYHGTGANALRGAYVLRDCKGEPDVILMATGSEVELICAAADVLAVRGVSARLVSMPCLELFEEQSEEYKESVLPKRIRARVAVEAACSLGWHKYAGDCGELVTIDRFGVSAPAGLLFKEFGFTPENVAQAALRAIERARRD